MKYIEDDLPNCCERGDEYISWRVDGESNNYKIFTGWAIITGYYKGNNTRELIFYCPFCDKKLEVIDD